MNRDKELLALADRIERLAFSMPAPNAYTPQFVEFAIRIRALAGQVTGGDKCIASESGEHSEDEDGKTPGWCEYCSEQMPAPQPEAQEAVQWDRESLGRLVRDEWEDWAREQPNPKPSWLTPWPLLTEPEREVDRRIGERIARCVLTLLKSGKPTPSSEAGGEYERAGYTDKDGNVTWYTENFGTWSLRPKAGAEVYVRKATQQESSHAD